MISFWSVPLLWSQPEHIDDKWPWWCRPIRESFSFKLSLFALLEEGQAQESRRSKWKGHETPAQYALLIQLLLNQRALVWFLQTGIVCHSEQWLNHLCIKKSSKVFLFSKVSMFHHQPAPASLTHNAAADTCSWMLWMFSVLALV